MNHIEFNIQARNEGNRQWSSVRIFVDGEDLIALLEEFEMPFAKKEGSPRIAGKYDGLTPELLQNNLANLPHNSNSREGKSDVLDCQCGGWGCWPMLVSIEVVDGKVIWSEFEQLHRSRENEFHWNYDGFGPFVFDLEQYTTEMRKLDCQ